MNNISALTSLAAWIDGSAPNHFVQNNLWMIPLLQVVHIFSVAIIMAAVLLLDLRLVGVGWTSTSAEAGRRFLPWIWICLFVLLVSGVVQILGEPARTLDNNPAFEGKMIFIIVGIIGLLLLRSGLERRATFWNASNHKPLKVTIAIVSFLWWCLIVFAGRWIAYFKV